MEQQFDHRLKKRKRRRRTHLSLNQSRNKKRKFNYGQQVKLIHVTDEYQPESSAKTTAESDAADGECSHQIKIEVKSATSPRKCLQANPDSHSTVSDIDESSSNESTDRDKGEFFRNCLDECRNKLINDVLSNFDKEGLLLHFMAFMRMIASGQLSVVNMAVLLAMEMALMFTLVSTTQMRYREDTSLFWEMVLSVGGPRTLRLFSSDKHFGTVNSGESSKSKYDPRTGHFNFAVPDEKTLRKSKTGLPQLIKCGIIGECTNLVDKNKEFVLSLDGKQVIPGLLNDSEGDVNLWGYEGPPTMNEHLQRFKDEEDIILNVVDKASREGIGLETFCHKLKFIVQIMTKRIRDLRKAKVRHEQLRARFNKKIFSRPDIGSRYSVAYSEIDCFI